MFKPHRLIHKIGSPDGEPWLIPEDQRPADKVNQVVDEALGEIIGHQGTVSEAIRGVTGAVTKTVDVGLDVAHPISVVVKDTGSALHDWFIKAPSAAISGKGGDTMSHIGTGIGKVVASPFKGLYQYPKRILAQLPYDVLEGVGDLVGVSFTKFEWKDKGLLPAVGSLLKSGWKLVEPAVNGVRGKKSASPKTAPIPAPAPKKAPAKAAPAPATVPAPAKKKAA